MDLASDIKNDHTPDPELVEADETSLTDTHSDPIDSAMDAIDHAEGSEVGSVAQEEVFVEEVPLEGEDDQVESEFPGEDDDLTHVSESCAPLLSLSLLLSETKSTISIAFQDHLLTCSRTMRITVRKLVPRPVPSRIFPRALLVTTRTGIKTTTKNMNRMTFIVLPCRISTTTSMSQRQAF